MRSSEAQQKRVRYQTGSPTSMQHKGLIRTGYTYKNDELC